MVLYMRMVYYPVTGSITAELVDSAAKEFMARATIQAPPWEMSTSEVVYLAAEALVEALQDS